MKNIRNAMTVDVEDYFQVSAFDKHISRADWDDMPHRIEDNVNRILSIFEEQNISATFFMLGWIAERFPGIIRNIVKSGHELASHGYSHVRVDHQSPEEFRKDIVKTKNILEEIGGVEVKGYRAASYSINSRYHWAHDELELSGHKYSSSIYPIRHDLYGIPDAPRCPYNPGTGKILEIPISTLQFFGYRFPCGGGGYFRLFPYFISKSMIRFINLKEKNSCIFYFHPWEIDINQPVQPGLGLKTRIRHYLNINKMEKRIKRLLSDFNWGRIDSIYL